MYDKHFLIWTALSDSRNCYKEIEKEFAFELGISTTTLLEIKKRLGISRIDGIYIDRIAELCLNIERAYGKVTLGTLNKFSQKHTIK